MTICFASAAAYAVVPSAICSAAKKNKEQELLHCLYLYLCSNRCCWWCLIYCCLLPSCFLFCFWTWCCCCCCCMCVAGAFCLLLQAVAFLLPYLDPPQSEMLQQLLQQEETFPCSMSSSSSSSSSTVNSSSSTLSTSSSIMKDMLMGGFRRLFGGLNVSYLPFDWSMQMKPHKPFSPQHHIL